MLCNKAERTAAWRNSRASRVKNEKFVILTVEDVGRAIVQYSQNAWHDKGRILVKAARIVRRFLFTKEETFKGNLYKQR